jgi:ComF family protein
MQTLRAGIRGALEQVVDAVLPPRCVVTGELVERQGMVAPAAWADLDFIADPFCNACGFPFDYEVDKGSLCVECLGEHPPYESARAALKYTDASRALILGFKHGDRTYAVKAFVPWMKRAGETMLAQADYLVPVPLHHWRLVSRRYNQAALIAGYLAKETGKDVLPDALVRTRATPSQGYLNAKERFKNVRRAFAMNRSRKKQIAGKKIILIDDVYTTGATVKECAEVLLKGGAEKVHVLTLARVTRDGHNN